MCVKHGYLCIYIVYNYFMEGAMRLCKDELLLLGGMFQVTALVISLFMSEIAYAFIGLLYIAFWLAVVAIVFNWVPKFVFQMNDRFPRISVFLASIGWIPYFTVLYALVSTGVDFLVSGSDSITVFLNNYMPLYDVYKIAVMISLLYAVYKVFYKKEDLLMACQHIGH